MSFSKDEIQQFIIDQVAEDTGINKSELDPDLEFINFGIDSIHAIRLLDKLEDWLDITLSPIYFWEYPTISLLSQFLAEQHPNLKKL
ncbi:MAG: acyl carrier protein [Bacteroidota bacterium]